MLAGYTELQELGSGGFGRVVLGRHVGSGQFVAIKYLFDRSLADDSARAQFRHEAAILARVVSPHVARLYDFVESSDGAAIVMEAVPGVPLREILTLHEVLPPEAALAVLKGSLLGLHAAHAAGTVHRDYKPANVLVQPDRQSKLVDFGVAVLAGHSGQSTGTPAYMAPEQWRGEPATPATDVYAATCVFFQCVTGKRPYEAPETELLRELHGQAAIPVDEVPEPLRELITEGMAKDARLRPASAAAFVARLETAARTAYGNDWERRGWLRLAANAGTLLALSPLAAFASTAGVLAPTGAAGALAGTAAGSAAGTAVGSTAGAAAGGGFFAAAGVKIAAVAVGVAVAAGTTVAVIETTTDDPPPSNPTATQAAARAEVAQRTESFDTFTFDGQYVQVSGLADEALQRKVNDALMAPIDAWIEKTREGTIEPEPDGQPAAAHTEADIRLQSPKVVSVHYTQSIESVMFGNRGGYAETVVSVDLSTGNELSITDAFPEIATGPGATELADRIRAAHPDGWCAGEQTATGEPWQLDPSTLDYTTASNATALQVAFTPAGVEFVVYAPALDYVGACGFQVLTMPYDSVADLMNPDVAALVTG